MPLPAFGYFCPYIPLQLAAEAHRSEQHGLTLSIGHDWRRHQAEMINSPLAELQQEGVQVQAPHLMPSNDQMALSLSSYPSLEAEDVSYHGLRRCRVEDGMW